MSTWPFNEAINGAKLTRKMLKQKEQLFQIMQCYYAQLKLSFNSLIYFVSHEKIDHKLADFVAINVTC